MKRIYQILCIVLLITVSIGASAQAYLKYEASLEGTAFHADSSTTVSDSLMYMYGSFLIDSDYLVKNVISLEIKDNESVFFPDSFNCTVKVAIEEYDAANNEITTYKILHVSYNAKNLALDTLRSFYQFNNKYRVKDSIVSITINGIAGSPDVFSLTNSIEIERQYITTLCGDNWFYGPVDTQYISTQDELYVSWSVFPTISGLAYDEFDLEWTFYDDSSVLIKNYIYPPHASPYNDAAFANNATRVQTANNWYQIPLLYEEGYVMFRVRTVQILPSGQRLSGPWTSTLDSGNNGFIYHIIGHQDSLNWQSKTSYAEEGKRKSVVSYFDGASKNRQSVTKINTDTMSIAAETIYDYEGRPVVNTLPSPTFQQLIRHFDNFNQDATGNPYSWQDADSSNDCSNAPGTMNTVSGSSRYYSLSNPLKSIGYNQYIPNAWGFPFSQQVYTPDLTGRIKFSSGPGLYHHMGTQHITQYLYGAPAQQELTELFGNEVGVASHYFKNATIDPNGQTTVTYTDMHGRTIATALSGTPLYASLDTLSEFRMDTILDVILDTNSNYIDGDSIICTKTFMSLVAPVDTYFFKYCLLPPSDTIQLCNGSDFCFDCIYDITIKITDDCNNHKLPGDTAVLRVLHDYSPSQSLNNFDTLCSNLPPLVVDSFYLPLPPGTYTVTKTLTINSSAINYYYNYFLTRDTCIKNFNDFYVNALNQVDMSGCNMTCQECNQQLGDSVTFVTKYLAAITAQDSLAQLQAQDTLNAASAYSELKSYCNMLCNTFTVCDQKRIMMLNDMSPGGQYALDTPNYMGNDPASIFYSGNNSAYVNGSGHVLLPLPVYSDSLIVYLNAQGVPDTLSVDTSGFAGDSAGTGNLVTIVPNKLSIQNFEKYWNPSWANALLPYHPEYCFYQFCIGNSASNEYDSWEASVSNYDTALFYGLMNPLNDASSPFGTPLNPDPFFAPGGPGANYLNYALQKMEVYAQTGGSPDTTISIWQMVAEMASNGTSNTNCPNCMKGYYWMNFRSIYQGIKQLCVDSAMSDYVHNTNNCNKVFPDFNTSSGNPLNGKTPRYGAIADSLWANANITNSSTLLDSTQVVYSADSTGGFSCTDYAPYWWGQLNQCGIPQADSALIINELIAVCALGTDSVHLYGSTTSPGSTDTTINGNWTFEQVLNWATAATASGSGGLVPWTYHPSDSCTSLLITNPMPYGTPILYYETDAIKPPDTCTCHKILSYYHSYAVTDSATMSFAAYLNQYYNMVIDSEDASILVKACVDTTCLLLPHPVEVPYQFECKEQCVTCADVQNAYNSFLTAFPGVVTSVNYLTLMQSWMNGHLGFNITAQEYMAFLNDSCGNNIYPVDTTSAPAQNCPVPSNSNSSANVINNCSSVFTVVSGSCTGNCNAGIISVNTGLASASGGQITYTAQGSAGSHDTIVYRVCNPCGLCDTAKIFISVVSGTCIPPSAAINHNYYICNSDAQTFLPVQGNTPPVNSQFTLTGFIPASPVGVTQNHNDFTYQAPMSAGADTFQYILCASGASTICDTAYVFIQINDCNWDSVPRVTMHEGKSLSKFTTIPKLSDTRILPAKKKSAFEVKALANLKLPIYQRQESTFLAHKKYIPSGINYAPLLKPFALNRNILKPRTINKGNWSNHPLWGAQASLKSVPNASQSNHQNLVLELLASWEKKHPFNIHDSILKILNEHGSVQKQGSNNISKGLVYYLTHRNSPKSIAYSMFHNAPIEPANIKAKADERLKNLMANGLRVNAMKENTTVLLSKYAAYKKERMQAFQAASTLRNAAMERVTQLKQAFIQKLKEKPATSYKSNPIGIAPALQVNNNNATLRSGMLQASPSTPTVGNTNHHRMKFDLTITSWCDSLAYAVTLYDSLYVATGNSNYGNLINFLYDSLGISQDIVYWQQQFAYCGISCPPIVNCSTVSGLMSTFESTYPQFSTLCPANIWANYLNDYGGGNGYWFNTSQWMAILNCCGITYPGPDTLLHNFCDSINAVMPMCTLGQSGTMGCLDYTLNNAFGWNYDPITGQFGDITYWLTQFNACGISCSSVLPCAYYDSLMSSFKTNNPSLADSCPAFVWVNYMNESSGSYYGQTDWIAMLNCCGATYPATDTFHSRCDSVTAVLSAFNTQENNGGSHSLFDFESAMGNVFGWGYYDSLGNYYNYTDSFWFGLIDSCHLSCPTIVNCQYADSLLTAFVSVYPSDSVPDFMWATYLNTNNAGTDGIYGNYWYSPQQWRSLLHCCGFTLPPTNVANTICDSLRDVITYFNYEVAQGQTLYLWDFENYVGNYITWNYDITYWYGLINSCNLACPNVISCQYTDSLLNAFIANNPELNDSIPDFMWTGFLNSNGAGHGAWYSTQQWRMILQCCSPPTLTPDSVYTFCDSLRDVVNYYNYQAQQNPGNNQNVWTFEQDAGMFISYGYNDNLGNWHGYDYSHWAPLIDSCHLSCPNIINCHMADSLMNIFLTQTPGVADSCPAFAWANYLNQCNFTNGDWYNTGQWIGLLTCCNIHYPRPDTLYSRCDTVNFIVNTNIDTVPIPLVGIVSNLNQTLNNNNNGSLGYWLSVLDSCGYSCGQFSNCHVLDSILTGFKTEYPQYRDSCPGVLLAGYLNLQLFNNTNVQGSYSDYASLYACCHDTLPRADSVLNHCDSASAANFIIQYYDQFVTQILDTTCKPVWIWNLLINQDSFLIQCGGGTLEGLNAFIGSCGYSSPDTCVFHTSCDSLNNMYQVIWDIWTANGGNSGNNGGNDFPGTLVSFYDQAYNSNAGYVQIMMQMIPCGNTALCDSLNSQIMPIVGPIVATYDSLCMPPSAFTALLNAVTNSSMSYAQWYQLLSTCHETLPPMCADSLSTTCEIALAADTLVTRALAVLGPEQVDITQALPQIMSEMLGYQVSYATADSLDSVCAPPSSICTFINNTYNKLGEVLHFDTCYPSWYITALWDLACASPDSISYGSRLEVYSIVDLCSELSFCNLPCPDTCGGLGTSTCDTITAVYDLYSQMAQVSGTDSMAVLYWLMNTLLPEYGDLTPGYSSQWAAYGILLKLHAGCNSAPVINCDTINVVYPYLNLIGTPATNVLSGMLNFDFGVNYTLAQWQSILAQCGDSTAVFVPTSTCDSVHFIWYTLEANPFAVDSNADSTMLYVFNASRGCYPILCYNLYQIWGLYYKCLGPTCSLFDSLGASLVNQTIRTFVANNPALLTGTQTALDLAIYNYLDSIFQVTEVNWYHLYTKCPSGIIDTTVNPPSGAIHYLCNRPLFPPIQAFTDDSCMATMQQYAMQNASMEYQDYLQALYDSFVSQYITKCLGVWRSERFYDRHKDGEYHYTLYYYDQAGNLVQTVPPDGAIPGVFPHTYLTKYRYNTQNQVVEQVTPDADTSFFWYDRIFKLTFSQNSKQYALNQFSYTNYDPIQRIIEVGRFDGYDLSDYAFWDFIALSTPDWYSSLITANVYPHEVTHTYYDYDNLNVGSHFGSVGMTNLRNRVASVIYADTLTADSSRYDAGTHYSYDVDGNVQTLMQENRNLRKIKEDWKRIDYQYDLISGKVNNVMYQSGQPDAFYHHYEYDADNRITDVYTSRDSTFFDHDAYYEYYLHGPLARAVIGDKQVQAVNYAYTIQGWLKAINGDRMNDIRVRMGQDGFNVGTNALVGYDAYGLSLGYFTGDYSNINSPNPVASDYGLNSWDLFNGNISRIKGFNLGLNNMNIISDTGMAYRYRYDQLNRLTGMNAALYVANGSDTTIPYTAIPDYGEHVSYDPNGNIATYTRHGTTAGGSPLAMDSMAYSYQPGNNRLDHVSDAVPASNYSVDIDNEDTLNYRYDQIGNLTKDSVGGIDSIYWTVYGKIWRIVKHNGDTIRFHYDPSGNRIAKEVFKDSLHKWIGTYYVHDAPGNIMSTYHWYNKDTFNLDELVMYGSSRLGTVNINQYLTDTIHRDSSWLAAHPFFTNPLCDSITQYATGLKQYEFTNHLGNVLVTLTDKHIPFYLGTYFAFYSPEVASAQDYYPFGMEMVGRVYNPKLYRFGFNKGSEKDNEIYGVGNAYSTFHRELDTRLGRWWSVDPEKEMLPEHSPYISMGDNPVKDNDVNGDCPNCVAAAIGAFFGGVIGGGIEVGVQLYKSGSVTNWKAVGGSAAQGAITGGVAGFTMGASLVVTTGTAVAANVVGGTVNRAVQGKQTTAGDVAIDAAIGLGGAVAGHYAGKAVKAGLDKLSPAAKGTLGETVTELKYATKGYISNGKAVVATGNKTATGATQVAKYDHAMKNIFTGEELTVESKFNTARLTSNQVAAKPNIATPGGLVVDRTTSQQLGGAANSIVRGGSGQVQEKK